MSVKIKIVRVVTVPIVYTHILDLLDAIYLRPEFELHFICSNGEYIDNMLMRYPLAKFHIISIPRKIEPLKDLFALYLLIRVFIRHRFDIVHSHTPKAGLLSAIAGFLTFRPIRLHTFTGQVWVNSKGGARFFFKAIDRIISNLNTHNYTDSYGQKKFLLREGVVASGNISVIHKGSLGGINIERFNPSKLDDEIKDLRKKNFPNFEGKILLYLGRINQDKGLEELQEAFFELKKKYSLKLLLVGPIESSSVHFENVLEEFRKDADVVFVKFTSKPELYLGICDIFCFPSYREGFGTVALEASAMQKPVIASDIYGLSDAVENGVSGLLCKVGDSKDLRDKIESLLVNPEFSKSLGLKGRLRVVENFSDKILTKMVIENYIEMIGSYRK